MEFETAESSYLRNGISIPTRNDTRGFEKYSNQFHITNTISIISFSDWRIFTQVISIFVVDRKRTLPLSFFLFLVAIRFLLEIAFMKIEKQHGPGKYDGIYRKERKMG